MARAIAVVGTLDTKGEEVEYLRQRIEARGHSTLVVDVGVLDEPLSPADITREAIAKRGGSTLEEIIALGDRREA
ncbi:MAG: Tm-1-like ATP-binding domain-containing protein, partial [Anaerolineae bacterium]|nr:Tm-1-like ATP-binding domain-containing protein [Anaerolineae bacterium]